MKDREAKASLRCVRINQSLLYFSSVALLSMYSMCLIRNGVLSIVVRRSSLTARSYTLRGRQLSALHRFGRTSLFVGATQSGASGPAKRLHQLKSESCRDDNLTVNAGNDSNSTLDWMGVCNSGFVTHVLISPEQEPCSAIDCIQRVLDDRRQQLGAESVTELSASALVELGAVWFLRAGAPRDPSLGEKHQRLITVTSGSCDSLSSFLLHPGDYLRIHHHPRRFQAVHRYDWSSSSSSGLPSVWVQHNASLGWLVIDKPAMVPVHMTVDNCRENVVSCVQQALARKRRRDADSSHENAEPLSSVSTPQRLDQNTSGLLVVSTSKLFANYYSGLLRTKTERRLLQPQEDTTKDGVHKLYRCLVCLIDPDKGVGSSSWSVLKAAQEIQDLSKTGAIVRHFLEPSVRAPKRFVKEVPLLLEEESSPSGGKTAKSRAWLECLLRIRKASPVYVLIGNSPAETLASALWNNSKAEVIPQNCQAVMEVEVELLTGRTHQIRGQLAALGFPLVGDVQYGGATNVNCSVSLSAPSQNLALQCCELEFVDPDLVVNENGTRAMLRSNRWNRFRLDHAWWSSLLRSYDQQTEDVAPGQATTLENDAAVTPKSQSAGDDASRLALEIGLVELRTVPVEATTTKRARKQSIAASKPARPDLLPVRVSLSPGKNKYVLVRATHPGDEKVQWFVKSAAPSECGGPYHGNVAQDLREWIEAAGYTPEVTGGGRIDYRPDDKEAVVYGFSYGFGKADHAKAAAIIAEWSKGIINATFDNREGLY